ncbi:MAG: hypothetical protein ACI3XG_10080 [Faecousia sp.]
MKKAIALLTLVLLLSSLTVPAFANMVTWDWSEHHTPLKHPGLMVLAYTEGTVIGPSSEERTHMTAEEMDEVVSAVLADEDQELIAGDLEVIPGRINYLEDRTITCPEAPFACHFRVWGTGNRVVLVFHRAEDADEWTLVLAQKGTDVIPEFPGNGTYAVGVTW